MTLTEAIEKITAAQAAINAATCLADGITLAEHPKIDVKSVEEMHEIARIIYGPRDWEHLHFDHSGGWTTAWLKSPEGVEFNYSDFDLDKAYFHILESERMDDGGWKVTHRVEKAVSA